MLTPTFTRRASSISAMSKRLILTSATSIAAIAFGLQTASAQTTAIGFETSEGYATAPAAFTGTPVNNATASIAFGSGNSQGWTLSSSTTAGSLLTTTDSGSYVGGQALGSGGAGAGSSYIGALDLGYFSGFTSIMFDVSTPATASSAIAVMGGWYDANSSGTYNQTPEFGVVGGLINGSFGIREANFGTTRSSGVAPTVGDWYRVTLTYDYANTTAFLDVFNLTTGLTIDLNGATAGDTYSFSSATMFHTGSNVIADPSTYQGIVARTSGDGLLDNILVTPVPEPSSIALLVGGFCMLAGLRRFRRQS